MKGIRRLAIPAALTLSLSLSLSAAACGSGAGTGGSMTTGVRGTVTIGPMCPVEQANSPCPNQPVPNATIQILDGSGALVASGTSGSDGTYRIGVPPGAYQVVAKNPSGLQKQTPPRQVTVPSDGFVEVAITFDSGIR